MMLAHTVHVQSFKRHVHAIGPMVDMNGYTRAGKAFLSAAEHRTHMRIRCSGGAQRRGGTARHRCGGVGLRSRGRRISVDIVQNCESSASPGRDRRGERAGPPRQHTRKSAFPRGHTSVIMDMAGVRLRSRATRCRRWYRTLKPIFPCVVMSNTIHAYLSQSTGELVIARHRRLHLLYAARPARQYAHAGSDLRAVSAVRRCACCVTGRHRRLTPDRSPSSRARGAGLYAIAAGYGGFKATRAPRTCSMDDARDEPHPIKPIYDRAFRDGRLIDEAAAAAVGTRTVQCF